MGSEALRPPDGFETWYRATLVSAYDADTIRCNLHLGNGIFDFGPESKGVPVRLLGIDAWEVRGKERPLGLAAKEFALEVMEDKPLVLHTQNDDHGKYGRLLADVHVFHEGVWVWLNGELVAGGHAEWASY